MKPLRLLGLLLMIGLSFALPAFAGQLENADSTQEAIADDKDGQAIGLDNPEEDKSAEGIPLNAKDDDSGEISFEAAELLLNLISIMAQILAR
jgi:hypothetical protein